MTGLILEFTDEVTQDQGIDDDREDWLRIPRTEYLDFIESARSARMEWVVREGADFICEACKAFIIPAQMLNRMLTKIKNTADYNVWDNELLSTVQCHLIRSYLMTDETLIAYAEGKLRHIQFIHDEKNELVWDEEGPLYLAYDEVVFKFRRKCTCDDVFRRMYENIAVYKGRRLR